LPDPFITSQDLTDLLGRNVTSDPGATIAIDAACDTVRTFTEQQINRGTSTVTLDGSGTDALVLPQLPVASLGTVTVAGSSVSDYALKDNGVLIRTGGTASTTTLTWPMGRQNVAITYVHGYLDADIPRDLRSVALALAQRIVVQGPAIQENSGQQGIRYAGPAHDLTKTEQAILRKYRPR